MSVTSARPGQKATGPGASGEAKHRACDECRSRKLACSKEPDGCARCNKEGITCLYSPQKTMGRPRKRLRSTSDNPVQVAAAPAAATQQAEVDEDSTECVYALQDNIDLAALDDATMDLLPSSLAYNMDLPIPDMTFLDFLGADLIAPQHASNAIKTCSGLAIDPTLWTSHLNDINLDPNLHGPQSSGSISLTPPSLASQSTSPSEDRISPAADDNLRPATCSCLAKLYLALDSLARLPTSVITALHTTRTAARAAHDALRCTVCCPPLHPGTAIGAPTFHNMMLVGTLIPSLADAYHKILALVDAETARAISNHTPLTFSLSAYGGYWGTSCVATEASGGINVYESKVMEPAMWRLSVRSLLKLDVYGADCSEGRVPWEQIGLRGLVSEMNQKSLVRHAEIDALIETGLPVPMGMHGVAAAHSQGKEPHCRPIIKTAMEAVESLHIA